MTVTDRHGLPLRACCRPVHGVLNAAVGALRSTLRDLNSMLRARSSVYGCPRLVLHVLNSTLGVPSLALRAFISAFGVLNSALRALSSAFEVLNLTFGVLNLTFGVRNPAFGLLSSASWTFDPAIRPLSLAFGRFSSARGSLDFARDGLRSAIGMSESGAWVFVLGVWPTEFAVGPWSIVRGPSGSARIGLGRSPGIASPARLGVAFTAVLLFLAVCAFQHAQDFPPVQIDQHPLQRGQHVGANRIQKAGLIFSGLVLNVELIFPAECLGLELPMQLQARLRAPQKLSPADGALLILAVGLQAHRAPPDGGRCTMRWE